MLVRLAFILLWFLELLGAGMPSSWVSSSSSNFENFTRGPEFAAKRRILRSIDKSVLLVNETTKVLNRNTINTAFERTRPATGKKRLREVSILGLFELSTRHGVRKEGFSELAAAQLAVQHINRRGLLLGYTLKLLTNDTKVCIEVTFICIIIDILNSAGLYFPWFILQEQVNPTDNS